MPTWASSAVLCLPWLLSGCGGDQSALAPAGRAAHEVALLWWWMLGVSTIVLIAVCGLWLWAQFRKPVDTDPDTERRIARRWLVGGGLVLPLVTIVVLLAFGIPIGHRMLPLPLDEPPMKIEVTGHQWWWEVHYPASGITLEDRIVMPAGRPVDFHLESADVIHSFWVPRLGGKIDMIPGRTNVLRLQADAPGRFRGQCAEFCGLRHAHMTLTVDALAEDDWQTWLAERAQADQANQTESSP